MANRGATAGAIEGTRGLSRRQSSSGIRTHQRGVPRGWIVGPQKVSDLSRFAAAVGATARARMIRSGRTIRQRITRSTPHRGETFPAPCAACVVELHLLDAGASPRRSVIL